MLALARLLIRALELLLALPFRILRALVFALTTRPSFGPLRHVLGFAVGYLVFALALVYVVAPLRGLVGQYFLADKLRYDAERWLATAVYDAGGGFVGTFDPRLDSQRDVNYTDAAIALGGYVANPDHKSIPVREVPEHYWQCLVYHEDRHIGGALNPYGIDLVGVLKIPYTTLTRSIALKRPSLGIGGSTLPMQFARVIYNTPPSPDEGGATKLKRKLKEWWLAPVIYRELTRGGDATPLKQWAANHIWLAQRTGGAPLHGVEITSRVVFGKEAKDLSDRRAVRAGVRRQQADHPAARQRQAQRGAARPLALHHRGARAHLRGEADRQRGRAEARHLRSRQPRRRTARPARQAQAAGGARGARAGAGPARARQSR